MFIIIITNGSKYMCKDTQNIVYIHQYQATAWGYIFMGPSFQQDQSDCRFADYIMSTYVRICTNTGAYNASLRTTCYGHLECTGVYSVTVIHCINYNGYSDLGTHNNYDISYFKLYSCLHFGLISLAFVYSTINVNCAWIEVVEGHTEYSVHHQ